MSFFFFSFIWQIGCTEDPGAWRRFEVYRVDSTCFPEALNISLERQILDNEVYNCSVSISITKKLGVLWDLIKEHSGLGVWGL